MAAPALVPVTSGIRSATAAEAAVIMAAAALIASRPAPPISTTGGASRPASPISITGVADGVARPIASPAPAMVEAITVASRTCSICLGSPVSTTFLKTATDSALSGAAP